VQNSGDIPREFEIPRLMGLEIVVLPQAVDGAPANLLGSRHRAATPISHFGNNVGNVLSL
jgi:hypothetical protein